MKVATVLGTVGRLAVINILSLVFAPKSINFRLALIYEFQINVQNLGLNLAFYLFCSSALTTVCLVFINFIYLTCFLTLS
jgi:hypothetical protein